MIKSNEFNLNEIKEKKMKDISKSKEVYEAEDCVVDFVKNCDFEKQHVDGEVFIDFTNCNPNGDPDNDNQPRIFSDGRGMVSDVAIKRRLRDKIIQILPKEKIFICSGPSFNSKISESYDTIKDDISHEEKIKENNKRMAEAYIDIKLFGAVLTTGKKTDEEENGNKVAKTAGIVRGAIQVCMAKSIDIIDITPLPLTNVGKADKDNEPNMGNKYFIPYGLYRFSFFINYIDVKKRNLSKNDIRSFLSSMIHIYEDVTSSKRAQVRKIILFKHKIGGMRTIGINTLSELFIVNKYVESPSKYDDYKIELDEERIEKLKNRGGDIIEIL